MSQSYVGVTQHPVDLETLKKLIDDCIDESLKGKSWYFLRWPHQIKLCKFGEEIDFSCTEGQVFNAQRELRWRQRGKTYDVLLLSTTGGIEPLESMGDWQTKDLPAKFYPKTETRFPKGIDYAQELDIGQRYFIDRQTASVQFIALRAM